MFNHLWSVNSYDCRVSPCVAALVGQMSNAPHVAHVARSLAAQPRTLGCHWTFVQRSPAHPLTRSPTHRPLKNWRRGRAGLGRGPNWGRKKTPHLSVWGEDFGAPTWWRELFPLQIGNLRLQRRLQTSVSPEWLSEFSPRFSVHPSEFHRQIQP